MKLSFFTIINNTNLIMNKSHDCKEVVTHFNMLLDGALNPKEEQNVMCELQRCIHCLEEYNLEEKYRNFLKDKIDKKSVSPECIEKIKDLLNKEL